MNGITDSRRVRLNRANTLALDHQQAFGSTMEFGAVAIIVCIVLGAAAASAKVSIGRAMVAEGISLSATARLDAVLWHADKGVWPSPTDAQLVDALQAPVESEDAPIAGAYVASVGLGSQGAIDVLFRSETARSMPQRMRGTRLTYQPLTARGIDGAPVAWHCGGKLADAAQRTVGENRTSLPADFLLAPCLP